MTTTQTPKTASREDPIERSGRMLRNILGPFPQLEEEAAAQWVKIETQRVLGHTKLAVGMAGSLVYGFAKRTVSDYLDHVRGLLAGLQNDLFFAEVCEEMGRDLVEAEVLAEKNPVKAIYICQALHRRLEWEVRTPAAQAYFARKVKGSVKAEVRPTARR